MWDWIVNILFVVLQFIQQFAVDWGLSIIILVLIVRIILTPLLLKSTKATARMQVLQPKMMEIQEKYADDPQRQAEELQKFYSENKFNPFGGCLPLLIQMPILLALFTLGACPPVFFCTTTFPRSGRLSSSSSSLRRLLRRRRPKKRSAWRMLPFK